MLKTIAAFLLSVLVTLWFAPGIGLVVAEEEEHEHEAGKYGVTLVSGPRFPVMGEEAELTCTIFHDGSLEEGLMVMVVLSKVEGDDHGHGAMEMEADMHAEGDEHSEAEHAEADEHQEGEAVEVMAIETAPGVYVAKYTFEQEGKYLVTSHIGTHAEEGEDEHSEFVVAVRSNPVAWLFMIGLAAVPLFLTAVVVVIKAVRKER